MDFENLNKVSSELKKNFNTMLEANKQIITNLPPEAEAIKTKILGDLANLPNFIEKKDIDSINALLRSYADKNNK
jgi:hypothetical protein